MLHPRLLKLILVTALIPNLLSAASAYQIKKFRFKQHKGLKFERLVIEFADKGEGFAAPNLKLGVTKSGENIITIENATLSGAIPEASINDSYTARSKYFGPIAFATDVQDGFLVRMAVKRAEAKVDAFWLQFPSRLIVDVFPMDSERALGPHVLHKQRNNRSIASHSPSKRQEAEANNVFCFTASAQVKAMLGYELGDLWKGIEMTVNDYPSIPPRPTPDSIVCFPKAAQVMPQVTFSAGGGIARLDFRPVSQATPLIPEPITIRGPKPASLGQPSLLPPRSEKDAQQQLNQEADLLLGLPSDAEIEAATKGDPNSASNSMNPWTDDFNKNNPPPTLGKTLVPPGSAKPQLASPGSFLPPTK
jgi:hypothetical protein